jgi:hypothetical protein
LVLLVAAGAAVSVLLLLRLVHLCFAAVGSRWCCWFAALLLLQLVLLRV